MPRINLTVQPELYDYILKHKPKALSLPAFCSLLIEQSASDSLDRPITLGEPSAAGSPSTSNSSSLEEELTSIPNKTKTRVRVREADPYKAKAISADLVPADLLDCQQLLPEFWAVKKGTRSEGVWNRVCGKLRGWTPEQRREALERAIASGWGDVFEPPTVKAAAASTGYVDSITRDRQVMDSFLAMFPTEPEAA
jgi:hypothetical protein